MNCGGININFWFPDSVIRSLRNKSMSTFSSSKQMLKKTDGFYNIPSKLIHVRLYRWGFLLWGFLLMLYKVRLA